jgi:hypothetical protein
MTIVWPIIASPRHMVATMSAGLFRSEVVAERSILDRTERGDQRRSQDGVPKASDLVTAPA